MSEAIRANDDLSDHNDPRFCKWASIELPGTLMDGKANLSFVDTDFLEGSLTNIIQVLTKVRDYYEAQGYRKICLSLSNTDDVYPLLKGYHLETEEELIKRQREEKALADYRQEQKLKREEYERDMYEKLKKKFEPPFMDAT